MDPVQQPKPYRRLTASELTFARLVRFYGIDPFRLAEISDHPELWGILVKAVEPLRAEEMLNGINVASMPHAKKHQARQFRKQLERELKVYEPKKVSGGKVSGAQEHDPVKAAEWFRSKGIGVVTDEKRE